MVLLFIAPEDAIRAASSARNRIDRADARCKPAGVSLETSRSCLLPRRVRLAWCADADGLTELA
jgi:hypothetical protein